MFYRQNRDHRLSPNDRQHMVSGTSLNAGLLAGTSAAGQGIKISEHSPMLAISWNSDTNNTTDGSQHVDVDSGPCRSQHQLPVQRVTYTPPHQRSTARYGGTQHAYSCSTLGLNRHKTKCKRSQSLPATIACQIAGVCTKMNAVDSADENN